MSELDQWWVHIVSVQTKSGDNAYGEKFANAVDTACYVEDDAKLVVDRSGNEVVSTSTLFADLSLADRFTVGSLVTLRRGPARVIAVEYLDSGSLGGPDHLEAYLS